MIRIAIVTLMLSFSMVIVFGHGAPNLRTLSILSAVTGFFTNAGVVGLYALLAAIFLAEARASGTGFAIGVGRGGSALAPIAAGLLFAHGFGLQVVAMAMASGSIIAATALVVLSRQRIQL